MTPIQETIINKKTNNSPIWLMRQAGRYLPEFREIRKLNPDFINLCLNENLSSEITLQPLKRFDLDAAIIFSDILMIPYGLNQEVKFEKNFGPKLGSLDLEKISESQKKVKIELEDILSNIPNIPHPDVPNGKDENDNIEISKSGKIPDGSSVVCTLTGHGLKDPDTAIAQCDQSAMINVNPTLDEVKKAILDHM